MHFLKALRLFDPSEAGATPENKEGVVRQPSRIKVPQTGIVPSGYMPSPTPGILKKNVRRDSRLKNKASKRVRVGPGAPAVPPPPKRSPINEGNFASDDEEEKEEDDQGFEDAHENEWILM